MGLSEADVERMFAAGINQPFQELCAGLVAPALRALARSRGAKAIERAMLKSPDRLMQAITQAARLAGFHERLDVDLRLEARIAAMSDAQLAALVREVLPQVLAATPGVALVDGQCDAISPRQQGACSDGATKDMYGNPPQPASDPPAEPAP